MKNQLKVLIGILVSIGCLFPIYAQDESHEPKITIEITKDINGEKKTFKGEYENEEQMKADPNYQEFAAEDESFTFFFDNDGDSDVRLWIDQFQDDNNAFFKFNFDDDSLKTFNLQDWAATDWKKYLKDLDIDVDALVGRFGHTRSQPFNSKEISISPVEGDEFGKKGTVGKKEKLELELLEFLPNPSTNGKMKIRFEVPEEGELSIKVYNIKQKEVFNRYFERFGGLYSESIDLSGQSEGVYLLEITHNDKRLTRKVIVN